MSSVLTLPATTQESMNVMLVEDDLVISLGLSEALKLLGYNVCCSVQSGEEAVEMALELVPDVILMDINLKGQMNGVRAAELITARNCLVLIIYLSAQMSDVTTRQALMSKHEGYLIKPFDIFELHTIVQTSQKRIHERQVNSRPT